MRPGQARGAVGAFKLWAWSAGIIRTAADQAERNGPVVVGQPQDFLHRPHRGRVGAPYGLGVAEVGVHPGGHSDCYLDACVPEDDRPLRADSRFLELAEPPSTGDARSERSPP
jgi:hypothetical protein